MALAELWRAKFTLFTRENRPPPDAPGPVLSPPDTPRRTASLDWLVPTFRADVLAMLSDLTADGWEPLVWETYRSEARALFLQRKGASKNGLRSLHRYGAAVDVVCAKHYWECAKHACSFYAALGGAAKRAGLYWGGDLFPRNRVNGRRFVDKPHVQAVGYRDQDALRDADDVDGFIRRRKAEQ